MRKINKKGFSLFELIVVIGVLVAITAFLAPSFVSLSKESKEKADMTKFETMCTAFEKAMGEPEVRKELDFVGGGAQLKVVYYIDDEGIVSFKEGELRGVGDPKPMKTSKLWLNSYQSIGSSYTTVNKKNQNKYLIFTLTPKTNKTTAHCKYELSSTMP